MLNHKLNRYRLVRVALLAVLLPLIVLLASARAMAQNNSVDSADSATLKTESKPQWEFGLAAAALSVPAYPASAVTGERRFLVPWFIYRGDKVRLQDGGLKLIALQNKRVTVDVSIGGSLNADSADTPLRAGMPDLDYLLELGPKVDVRLWDHESDSGGKSRLNWSTALRLAVSTDFSSLKSRGPVLGTELSYRRSGLLGADTFFSASAEAFWVGEKMMDYFYQVDTAFVTPQRAAFDAQPGYIGSAISLGVGRNFNDKVSGFIGLRVALHDGARNSDSPLFEDNTGNAIFGGLSWTLKQSKKMTQVLASD